MKKRVWNGIDGGNSLIVNDMFYGYGHRIIAVEIMHGVLQLYVVILLVVGLI